MGVFFIFPVLKPVPLEKLELSLALLSLSHFERLISQERIRKIDFSTEGLHSVHRNKVILVIEIFSERNYFLVLL